MNFNSISTRLELFYLLRLKNYIYNIYIYISVYLSILFTLFYDIKYSYLIQIICK